ncbi:MAG TPA: SGNH/GDSL hydrolase family protein [Povalibacter sp.]|jgi:phospholipase/lecithinase/hemolysin|nr:SGNH/GDSL hydrolase family protein [Povalibacter sp.]
MNRKPRAASVALVIALFVSACNEDGNESKVNPPPASTQTITQVVAFGDSLSDAGTYNPTTADTDPANDSPSGLIFSTKPGTTYAVYVAGAYGKTLLPNQQVNFGVVGNGGVVMDLGGLDYAEGGARITVDAPNGGVVMQSIPNVGTLPVQLATSRSIKTQIDDYLSEHGSFSDNQLVLIQGGANDLFLFLGQVAADPSQAANAATVITETVTAMVTQIGRLKASGASHVIYSNLPDLGLTPQFSTTPLAGLATTLATNYNAAVAAQLNAMGGVHIFDTAALIHDVVASPSSYGFTNATAPACNSYTTPGNPATLTSLICSPATLVAPGADITYVFADGVHPTARAHALWADQLTAAFPSP